MPIYDAMGNQPYSMNAGQTPVNNYMVNNQNFYQRPIDISDYVNGFNGAANYPIPMGRTGLLIDFSIGKFWIKSPGGPQPMVEFDFKRVEYNNQQMPQNNQPIQPLQIQNDSVSREEFENQMNEIKGMIAEMTNAFPKSNKTNDNKKFNNQKG